MRPPIPPATSDEPRQSPLSHPRWHEDQPRRLLQHIFLQPQGAPSVKAVAHHMAWHYDLLLRCINGQKSLPAEQLQPLYWALGSNIQVYSCLLPPTLQVIPVPQPVLRRSRQRIFEELLATFATIYRLFSRIVRGKGLTEAQILVYEEEVIKAKQALDESLQMVREQAVDLSRTSIQERYPTEE